MRCHTEAMYYLDTSAIRSLGKNLKDVSLRLSCVTSAFTVFELVSGIDTSSNRDFIIRKSALKNLKESNVKIKWVLHEQIIARAFGVNEEKLYNKLATKLRKVFNLILISDDNTTFLEYLDKENLKDSFDLFKRWDSHISTVHSKVDWSNIKDALQKEQHLKVFDDNEVKNLKSLGNSLNKRHRDLNFSMSLWALASSATGESEPEDGYNNYDDSIDIYVVAFSNQSAIDISNQRNPGKNDGADLYHLLYLNEGDVLVSNDQGQIGHIKRINEEGGIDVNYKLVDEILNLLTPI